MLKAVWPMVAHEHYCQWHLTSRLKKKFIAACKADGINATRAWNHFLLLIETGDDDLHSVLLVKFVKDYFNVAVRASSRGGGAPTPGKPNRLQTLFCSNPKKNFYNCLHSYCYTFARRTPGCWMVDSVGEGVVSAKSFLPFFFTASLLLLLPPPPPLSYP